jgi:cell division septum initiation protein DivIVA
MSAPKSARFVDLDEVGHLVDQLERDLAKAREGGASVDTLRAEVEQLRLALNSAEPSHDECKLDCMACARSSMNWETISKSAP